MKDRRDIETVYLGNYAHATANAIAGACEEAGIFWWAKNPSAWTRVLFAEFGVRMFVDKDRLTQAREIAERLVEQAGG